MTTQLTLYNGAFSGKIRTGEEGYLALQDTSEE